MEKELSFREALRAFKGMYGESSFLSIEEATNNYEGLETMILEWLKNNPIKTRRQDFIEKFPNAPLNEDGTPGVCCEDIGYKENVELCGGNCFECWNKPIDE